MALPVLLTTKYDWAEVGVGASRVEQLIDTFAAADCKLDSALKTRLDEVSIEFRRGDAGK